MLLESEHCELKEGIGSAALRGVEAAGTTPRFGDDAVAIQTASPDDTLFLKLGAAHYLGTSHSTASIFLAKTHE